MPKNRFIYAGVLVISAAAVLWVAAQILKKVEYALLSVAIIGIILVVVGLVMEAREGKQALLPGTVPGEPLIPIAEAPKVQPAPAGEPEPMPMIDTTSSPNYTPEEPH